jgi:hypothetical protein
MSSLPSVLLCPMPLCWLCRLLRSPVCTIPEYMSQCGARCCFTSRKTQTLQWQSRQPQHWPSASDRKERCWCVAGGTLRWCRNPELLWHQILQPLQQGCVLCASTKLLDVLVLSLCRDPARVANCDFGERQYGVVGEASRCSRSKHNNSMPHQQLHLQNSIELFCLPCRCSFLCCCSVPCRVLAPQEPTRPSFTDMSLCVSILLNMQDVQTLQWHSRQPHCGTG